MASIVRKIGALVQKLPDLVSWAARNPLSARRNRKLILASGLFDRSYYARIYPDIPGDVDPLDHYMAFGAGELRNPCLLFDARFYVSQPGLVRPIENPLLHYLQVGAAEGRNPHPVFDSAFYRARYPDLAETGVNPLGHYVAYGSREGRDPHPLFDTAFYLHCNPDVATAGLNPLEHYLDWGCREGRAPHALFDTAYYVARYGDVAESGANPLIHYLVRGAAEGRSPHPLFDAAFYLNWDASPEVAVNPLLHYIALGGKQGLNPHPLFDSRFYLESNPDVASGAASPLEHYVRWGFREGRAPHRLFDPAYYVQRYPEVAGQNPLLYFLMTAAGSHHTPHPLFDAGYYLETYPDVALENVNPLRHYVEFGSKEGRSPHYLFDPAFVLRNCPGVSPHGRTVLEQFLESHSGRGASPHWMFDSSFYLARNPDIAATGRGPWRHFLESGASDQRDPHPLFDCSFYLSTQPDVRRSGLNPLEHFIRYGAREGRSPHFLFDFTAYLSARPELGTFQNVAQHAGEAAQARLARNRERRIQRMSRFIHDQSRARRAALKPRLSVVIPTYNRAEILEGTLQRCLQLSQHLPVEFLVVSDGSTDNTLDCLNWYSRQFPSLHFAAIEKSGPGAARNVGAAQAKGELIMFMGDDIRPADSEFFAAHLRAHEKFSDAGAIVEGHIKWPNQSGFAINAVMRLIQGSGAQQFAYHYMQPFAFFDWRYFWTANTSIKRTLVKDWSKDGFNPVFNKAACEDTEFAYRQAKVWANLRIYYAADSVGEHFHPYRVGTFVDRQRNVGEMTRALLDLHPELASHMSVEELDTALRSGRPDPKDVRLLPEFEGVVRGLQSWGAIMEAHEDLGSQEWHDTYLNALFQLSHGEGYLNTFRGKGGNLAEGYRVLLRRFHQRLSGSRAAAPLMHTIAIS